MRSLELSLMGSVTQTWGSTLAELVSLLKRVVLGWKRVLRAERLARRRAHVRHIMHRYFHPTTTLREGPNRLFQVLNLYCRSPESGDLWYASRPLKKAI